MYADIIICIFCRWELRLCLHRALQEGRLHKECKSQLVRQCQDGCVHPGPHLSRQCQICLPGRQRQQRLHQAQTGDYHPQWSEASQGSPDPAQQEDCTLIRPGPDWHHRRYQVGFWSRQETVHRGWKDGRCSAWVIKCIRSVVWTIHKFLDAYSVACCFAVL